MSDNFSKKIIRETFESKFDKSKFSVFIKNLLNHIEDSEEDKFVYSGQYIPEVWREGIKSLERIGKYTDPDGKKIELLIVNLKKENSLDKARTLQRNFVAWYLDGSRNKVLKDAALVAFVSPDLDSWRFSLVKMDYKIHEARVKKDLTPAKRYSFLVGSQEKSHTAQSRLVPIIEDDKNDPTLKQLEEAFNIEKVTKEFFEKYRDLFIRLKESLDEVVKNNERIKTDFQSKNIDTASFAKKLLGQIVFLYFLQKKGWFGVERDLPWGSGPKNFLRVLFDKQIDSDKNFFNDILEPLFYEALAKKRDQDYYSKLDCKIPFLNGGLFDPVGDYDWVGADILIDDELFSNDFRTKEGDRGTGILDVFDRYNFTVREDEPLEKEVAVDPEMLGKVFENLLEVKDRKSKGTYYTPREIVHYMCQESLINYLSSELSEQVSKEDIETLIKKGTAYIHNDQSASNGVKKYEERIPANIKKYAQELDDKLKEIKVCDPAVGSGAFLVGMMSEIVGAREVLGYFLGVDEERSIYRYKRWAIQNSLYGVDIDPSAVEVAKLRLWLSLVVEEDNIKDIKPLPNLDYKVMQGNSLLEDFKGVKLFDERIFEGGTPKKDEVAEMIEKQNALQKEFFLSNNKQKKDSILLDVAKLTKAINKLGKQKKSGLDESKIGLFEEQNERKEKLHALFAKQKQFFNITQKSEKDRIKSEVEKLTWELIEVSIKEENKLDTLKEIEVYKNNGVRPFFLWKLYFADVFQEKGGFDVIVANPPYVGEKKHKEIFQEIRQGNLREFYQGKMDLFYFFFHLALNLGKEHATIAFITTNYFPTASGAKKLRTDLKQRSTILNLINFNELRIFESAQGQHNMVTIFRKGVDHSKLSSNCITKRKGTASSEILQSIVNKTDSETDYFEVSQKGLYDGDECYIRLGGIIKKPLNSKDKVLNRISQLGKPLILYCNVNQGIVTGADKVSQKHIEEHGLKSIKGEGIFVLNEEVIGHEGLMKENRIFKPWFKNSDVFRWGSRTTTSNKVIYLDRTEKTISSRIKGYLEKFKKLLIKRREVQSKVINWWQLQWPREKQIFEGEKIIAPQRSIRNTFGYNEIPWYASADVYFITKKDESAKLKYILALLNSKLYYFWLYNRGKRKGEALELYQKPLSEIPIKLISTLNQETFVKIVDKILELTDSKDYIENPEKRAKVRDYESQIDKMVYELYKLTDDEIKIVEESDKN